MDKDGTNITNKRVSRKVPFYDKFVYSLSSGFSSNMAVYIFSYYLTYFLTDMRGLSAALAGIIILGSRIFDTITDFIIGMLIDRVHFKSGKFRGWIKLGMIPMLIGLPLIFVDINNMSYSFKIVWTIITYGLYGSVFTTILYTPTNAELVNMTSDIGERGTIVGMREIFNNVAMLVISSGFLPLAKILGKGNNDRGFFLASAVLAVVAFIFQVWNLMMQRKYELGQDIPKVSEGPKEKVSIKDQLGRIVHNRPALVVIIGMFAMNVLMGIKSGMMLYTFKYYFLDEDFFSVINIFFIVAAVVGAMLIKYFVKLFKESNRAFLIVMIISMVLNVLYFALIKIMGMEGAAKSIHFGALFFIFVISGLFQGAHYGFPTLLISNAIDYGEWKFKRSDIGVIYGFNSLAMSLGQAIGGAGVSMILAAIGYKAGMAQSEAVLNGILIGAILIPVVLTMVQFILHIFFGLSDEEHEKCVRELNGEVNN